MGSENRPHPAPAPARRKLAAIAATLALGCAAVLGLGVGPSLAAPSIDDLNSRIADAKQEAQALGAQIDSASAQLAAAQQEAIAAAQREAQLSAVLAQGQRREARLEAAVAGARDQLTRTRARLGRSRKALSDRLVAIYRSGMPDATTVLLNADGFDDLATRAEYLSAIEHADSSLVSRVRQLRDQVAKQLSAVEAAQQRAEDFNARISAARDQIDAVRADAQARASQLAGLRAERQQAIETLQSKVGDWTDELQKLERISAAQAQTEVAQWFGDWAIPEAIVICESGGNFRAVNPSSGAGGAYQILPSTWELYGGQGLPQDASPAEQSRIAAQIWADSGGSAWVCAQ
jgi:septal ring factor EnvC (AmiA/AmiB activator)